MEEDIELLNNLREDDTFKKIEDFANQLSIYNILGVSRKELQHSNVLAWLLSPLENHGLSDIFLKKLMNVIIEKPREKDALNYTMIDNDIIDHINGSNVEVKREYKNIDILVTSENEGWVLIIENKIYSKEHGNQLNKYFDIINKQYPSYKKMYVYLSIDDYSKNEQYVDLHYSEIIVILNEILNEEKVNEKVKILLEQYVYTLRRITMDNNNEVSKLCFEIYKKHKKAIDLIIENISDISFYLNQVEEYFNSKEKEGLITVVPHTNPKSKVFLTPNCLRDKFLSNYEISWLCYDKVDQLKRLGSKYSIFYYEVKPIGSEICFYLWMFSPSRYYDKTDDDNIKRKINDIVLKSKDNILQGHKVNKNGLAKWIALYKKPIINNTIIAEENFNMDTAVKDFFDKFFKEDFNKIEDELSEIANNIDKDSQ